MLLCKSIVWRLLVLLCGSRRGRRYWASHLESGTGRGRRGRGNEDRTSRGVGIPRVRRRPLVLQRVLTATGRVWVISEAPNVHLAQFLRRFPADLLRGGPSPRCVCGRDGTGLSRELV